MAWSRGHGTETSSSEVLQTHTHTHFVQIGQGTTCLTACRSLHPFAGGLRSSFNISVTQDRLAQQQKAMAEERAYLKEIISRMDAQLGEQQRQLEKVRVKSGFRMESVEQCSVSAPD